MSLPTRDLPALPLRLAAEPYAKKTIGSSCVALGIHLDAAASHSHANVEIAVLIDDNGIRAFCLSNPVSRRVLFDLIGGSWQTRTLPCLIRQHGNEMEWHVYLESDEFPTKVTNQTTQVTSIPGFHDAFVAKLLTESIRLYYAQQILEPSVRGFLSVLEKQFARSDLYLFELLQNAVDDGATIVKLEALRDSLHVSHNGRNFTPLDVLGLSSVGLSTKSREGKRTIGFMGVGFKAVYKRYSRVVIQDGTYAFCYEKPVRQPSSSSYGWVMQPLWLSSPRVPPEGTETWCHFHLERPTGGMGAIQKDFAVLPPTAPSLLGRAALDKGAGDSWTLDWNGQVHLIRRTNTTILNKSKTPTAPQDRSEVVTVDITNRSGRTTKEQWLFISHKYIPSRRAQESYHNHTKRQHTGEEEVCGFLRLGTDRTPLVGSKGIVHSVLPTKLCMPIPMNVQGAWLLSVDRQEVQDFGDNEWNKDLVLRLPMLIANFFRWAAREELSTPAHYQALGKLLPSDIAKASPVSVSSTEFLGQTVSLEGLEKVLYSERVLPVALPSPEQDSDSAMDVDAPSKSPASDILTGYYEGEHAVWIPPSWFKFLGANLLRNWLGKRPLRTDLLGDAAFHPLFSSRRVICQLTACLNRTDYLAREIGIGRGQVPSGSSVEKILCLMAAIGSVYEAQPKTDTITDDGCTPNFPDETTCWPVFLTENGELCTVGQVVLPADDFAAYPEDLSIILRPFFIASTVQPAKQSQKGARRGGRKKNPPRQVTQKKRLHPLLAAAMYTFDSGSNDFNAALGNTTLENPEEVARCAASFLSRARAEAAATVVSVATATSNMFSMYAKLSLCQEEHVTTLLRITEFALSTNDPSLLSFVLVQAPPSSNRASLSMSIVPAKEAYIGKALDESGPGADLESFSRGSLPFISSRYNEIAKSATEKRKLLRLLDLAGVQSGLSVMVSAVVDVQNKSDHQLLSKEVLPKLPNKKLPPTRNKATKSTLFLPYGLDVPMDRRRYSLIDAQLAHEWEGIIQDMSPEAAVGFVSLLLEIPFDDAVDVTAKTTPAAAQCFAGRADTDRASAPSNTSERLKTVRLGNDTLVPLRRRLYFLPPGQPGAKALDVSPSSLVTQLARLKWLPCKMPSSRQDTVSSFSLLRPEQALLLPDHSHPEMPVVQLPAKVLARLRTSPLASALVWGTQAPPPPIVRLAELAKQADALLSSSNNGVNANEVSRVAAELIVTWTAIARAHLRDGLKPSERKQLRAITAGSDGNSNCIPVRRCLDSFGTSGSWIIPASRCVLMPDTLNTSGVDDQEKVKRLTVVSFVAANFMCDFNHIGANPFFSTQELSAAVIQLANIPSVESLSMRSIATTSALFIRFCCRSEPVISSRSSPLRSSYSYAMKWCMQSPRLLDLGDVGGLKVWVRRGPGSGAKALPARWIPVKNGPVQVALDDDKRRFRSSLLTPKMGVQLLGVLDHFPNERTCPNAEALNAIDRAVLKHLGVLRLSDKEFTLKTKASGSGTKIDGDGASSKLQLVCALLKSMEAGRFCDGDELVSTTASSSAGTANGGEDYLDPNYVPVPIIRHDSMSREFKAPGMNAPSISPVFAVWGRAPKRFKLGRCILVSGEPEDYSVELEQLVVHLVCPHSNPSISNTKDHRAALRLLSHLENNSSFDKFVDRDFADSEVVERWRRLVHRTCVLEKLRAAEKARDANTLRAMLIEAEEVLENDHDEGDAILRGPRELLPKLGEEEAARRAAEAEKEAVENERKAAEEAAVKEQKEAFEKWKEEEKAKALSSGGGGAFSFNAAPAPRGRGRGMTLPAWVTGSSGATTAETNKDMGVEESTVEDTSSGAAATEEAKSILSSILEDGMEPGPDHVNGNGSNDPFTPGLPPPQLGTGRGRGISNLPAWMSSKASAEDSVTNASAGRGRGISNLPAWMTADTNGPADGPSAETQGAENANEEAADDSDTKRSRTETTEAESPVDRPSKKARTEETPFQVSFTGTINHANLTDFLSWLTRTIDEGAKNHGASVSHFRTDGDA